MEKESSIQKYILNLYIYEREIVENECYICQTFLKISILPINDDQKQNQDEDNEDEKSKNLKFTISSDSNVHLFLKFLEGFAEIHQIDTIKVKISKTDSYNELDDLIISIFKWLVITKFCELKHLDISSEILIFLEETQLLIQLLTSQASNLDTLSLDIKIDLEDAQQIEINPLESTLKELKLFNQSKENLIFLQLFPKLEKLYLNQGYHKGKIINEDFLEKIVNRLPQLQSLELEGVKYTEYELNLKPIKELKYLKVLKIGVNLVDEMTLPNLSSLTNLKHFLIQSTNPINTFFFGEINNCLESLALVISQNYNLSKQFNFNKHTTTFSAYKQLKSIKIITADSKYSTLPSKLLNNSLEMICEIALQLQNIEIIGSFEADKSEQTFKLLIFLLGCCQNQTKILIIINISKLFTKEQILDIALAIRSMKYPELVEFENFPQERSAFGRSFRNNDEKMIDLGKMGTSKEISFSKCTLDLNMISTFNEKESPNDLKQKLFFKKKQLLLPFINIAFSPIDSNTDKKYLLNILSQLSRDLLYLDISIGLQVFEILQIVDFFPKIIKYSGIVSMNTEQESQSQDYHFTPSSCNIVFDLDFFGENFVECKNEFFSIKGHLVYLTFHKGFLKEFSNTRILLNDIFESNNRISLKVPKHYPKSVPEQIIIDYCSSVVSSLLFQKAFFNSTADLLPINPKLIFYDLFF